LCHQPKSLYLILKVNHASAFLSHLHPGSNTIELLETNYKPDDAYVMYDYLALEMPGTPPAK